MDKTRYTPFLRLRLAMCALWLWLAAWCTTACAQQFSIRSFRPLPNDISAYIDPVRDLNGDACALLKVVADAEFAFSTPLGVVKRRNDVGEIWLYLPRGTVRLTLKHPRWGVLRDFRLPQALEPRMTYELVVSPAIDSQPAPLPWLEDHPVGPDTALHRVARLPVPPARRPRRPREPWRLLLLAQGGYGGHGLSGGLRVGAMRRHGAYVSLTSDFRGLPSTQGECSRTGHVPSLGLTPYYIGHVDQGRWTVFAGGLHRLWRGWCLYEGLGYGERRVAWQRTDLSLLRNTGYSARGLSAEAGVLVWLGRLALSAGVQTIGGKYWEGTLGVGVAFW